MTASSGTQSLIIRYRNLQPVGQKVLDKILNYTNTEMKEAIAQRKPLVTNAGPRSLIFRGAITGVDTSKEGLQFYEVVPVALVVAGRKWLQATVPWILASILKVS